MRGGGAVWRPAAAAAAMQGERSARVWEGRARSDRERVGVAICAASRLTRFARY